MKNGLSPDKILHHLLHVECRVSQELISKGYHSLVPGIIWIS